MQRKQADNVVRDVALSPEVTSEGRAPVLGWRGNSTAISYPSDSMLCLHNEPSIAFLIFRNKHFFSGREELMRILNNFIQSRFCLFFQGPILWLPAWPPLSHGVRLACSDPPRPTNLSLYVCSCPRYLLPPLASSTWIFLN